MSAARKFAGIRRRAGRAAWRAVLGPVSGSVPRSYVNSVVGSAGTKPIAAHIESIELLTPAHVEHYRFDAELPPEFRQSKAFDDRFVYRLRDVCTSPSTGLCWLPEGAILEESYGSLNRLLGWGDTALEEPLLRTRQTIEGPVVPLPGAGYFHWLLEALPTALHALDQVPDATVLLPRTTPPYLDEALDVLGIEKIYRSDEPLRVEELVLVSRAPFSGFVPREDVEILRNTFLPRIVRGAEEALYISRRLSRRSPSNEADLERAFERIGFRVINAERLSFVKQIELFAGSTAIVGSHGAGLANVVWSDASILAELFVADYFNDCYARLSVSLGVKYRPFHCSTQPGPWGTAPVEEIVTTTEELIHGLEASGGNEL